MSTQMNTRVNACGSFSVSELMRNAVATVSVWQVDEQPSPDVVFPSSHVSPISTTELPHLGMQSVSFSDVAPGGQHPSPLVGVVIGVNAHVALHVPALINVS